MPPSGPTGSAAQRPPAVDEQREAWPDAPSLMTDEGETLVMRRSRSPRRRPTR